MPETTRIEQAAAYMTRLMRDNLRVRNLPPELAPATRAEAYRVQAFYERQSASPLVAWKIAATSLAGQRHIGVDGPLAGRYIAERVVQSGGSIPLGNNVMRVAEIEFAYRMGLDLLPRAEPYDELEVLTAVASLHPTIEIPDSRFERFETVGAPALIADNACAYWLCIGGEMTSNWRDTDLATVEPLGLVLGRSETRGKGSNVLGSPLNALVWITNELSSLGIALKAGQYVSTGTCVVPMTIAPGDHVTGDFGRLGRVECRIV